ncbi:hypothetical protein Y1Q_0021702 [Alligator mississippiensis]|uniref:DDE Tnp4 domain-containing protein n=1 Tax=Alligator mississippiensis TaxID=8496 RepID=A0A151PB00_ALLMI|nr:hypothetical protein Y1Q_0021702 [Alligator mississippiensis]
MVNCFLINPQEVDPDFHYMGFPNCKEPMDGTHTPIFCLPQDTWAFINCKGNFFIVLKGVFDPQDYFIHIFTSWVGSARDAHVFHNFSFPEMRENAYYIPGVPSFITGSHLINLSSSGM